MNARKMAVAGLAAILLAAGGATAQVSIETVPVGNPGNAGELSGAGAGGYGPDRICGAVTYEYRIGKYEVTAGQYCEFLNAVAKTDTYGLYSASMDSNSYGCQITQNGPSGNHTYDFSGRPSGTEADWANRPVNYVSFWDACRFANWLHNGQGSADTETGAYTLTPDGIASNTVTRNPGWQWAVCSEDEWYKAAYYDPTMGSYYDYPTSSNTAPGYVNDSGNLSATGTPFVEGGVDAGNYATYNGDYGTAGIGDPYYRTVVGEWENSDSAYGTFDQGGNVSEWNDTIFEGVARGLRGGFFNYSAGDGGLHASHRGDTLYAPSSEGMFLGFRVCQVPEPGFAALLLAGVLGLLRRRRRR